MFSLLSAQGLNVIDKLIDRVQDCFPLSRFMIPPVNRVQELGRTCKT